MSKLKIMRRPDRIARGIFDFDWDNIHATITIDGGGKGRDRVEVRSEGVSTFTDQCALRVSELSRKRFITSLVDKGFMPRDDAESFVAALNQFFIDDAPELTELARDKETPAGVSALIENDLDPRFVFDNFDRALLLAKSPDLLIKLRDFIRGLLVAPSDVSDAVIYHQASVCAPPIPRYSQTTGDRVLERGSEALLPYGLSGSGKGALLKLLGVFGVRLVPIGRITRAAIERCAKELLHHTTLFFPEITAIYAKDSRGEQIDTQLAQVLRQAIEDNKITLVVTEKDEATGKQTVVVHDSGLVYPAPIMTTVEDVKDIQMRTRALPIRLPDTVGGYLEIGEMIAKNVMLSEQDLARRGEHDGLKANDVKLFFQLINCMNEGLLIKFYEQLDSSKQAEINETLKKHGLTLDSLKPISSCEMTNKQRSELLRRWFETIVVFVLPAEIEFEDGKKTTRADLLKMLEAGGFDEVHDVATALGKDAKPIEGISRDLWGAFRRAQSSGLLHAFQRETRLVGSGETRALVLNGDDIQAAVLLLDRIAVERLQVGLPPREKEIIMFVIRNTNEEKKLTAQEVAEQFYRERGERATGGRIRYIQRVLGAAAKLGHIRCDDSEKTHRYFSDYTTTELQFGIEQFVGKKICGECGKQEGVHFVGKGIGWVCDGCHKRGE